MHFDGLSFHSEGLRGCRWLLLECNLANNLVFKKWHLFIRWLFYMYIKSVNLCPNLFMCNGWYFLIFVVLIFKAKNTEFVSQLTGLSCQHFYCMRAFELPFLGSNEDELNWIELYLRLKSKEIVLKFSGKIRCWNALREYALFYLFFIWVHFTLAKH